MHPVFKNRVQFDFSLLKKENLTLEELFNFIKSKSIQYYSKYGKVHSIVEFIFKTTASKFINLTKNSNDFFDEILILSGDILESRKKEVISKIKNSAFTDKNILLITTQVIEAGVDIDMDIGFKDKSLIDSEEQLAGRINRNIKKKGNKIYIFNLDKESLLYSKDDRMKISQNDEEYKRILVNKNFDALYNKVMENRNLHNTQLSYDDTIEAYLYNIKRLNFDTVDVQFQIIKNSSNDSSVFIPISLKSSNFIQAELDFLREHTVNIDNYVSGEDVWKLFQSFIAKKEKLEFKEERKQIATIFGIISKFIINIDFRSKRLKELKENGSIEESHGYLYLHNPDEVYNYKTGFIDLNEEEVSFW
jgi:CRISPR-associated endonuclease/helicase Cas3